LVIKNRLRESFPNLVAHRLPGEFSCRFLELASKSVIAFFATCKANDRDRGRKLAISRQIVESGDELAMSEVTGRAENHDAARLRHGPSGQAFAQRICLLLCASPVHGCKVRKFPSSSG